MHPSIRIVFTLVFLCSYAFNCFAGAGIVRPVKAASYNKKPITRLDSLLTSPVLAVSKKSALSDKECRPFIVADLYLSGIEFGII